MFKHMDNTFLGLDIGGSHISGGIVHKETHNIHVYPVQTFPTDCDADEKTIFDQWVNAIISICEHQNIYDLEGIGIALPGPFQYDKGISAMRTSHKYGHLFGRDVRYSIFNRLKKHFNLTPDSIQFINDARSFLLGSIYSFGWINEKVLGLTIGTGLGSAFFANEGLITDKETIPPEGYLYNLPFKDGVTEDYFSSRWIVDSYNESAERFLDPVKNVKDMSDQYDEDPFIKTIFNEFGENLAGLMDKVYQMFTMDRVVLGGNIFKAYEYFKLPFLRKLQQRHHKYVIEIMDNTSRYAIKGAVEYVYSQNRSDQRNKSRRNSEQSVLPVKKTYYPSSYDRYPTFKVDSKPINIGYEQLAEWIAKQEKVIIDGFSGIYWDKLVGRLNDYLNAKGITANWYCVDAAWKCEREINTMLEPFLGGDDPVFGKKFNGALIDFFDQEALSEIKPAKNGINIIYGSGAALAEWEGSLIYVDVPKNEIQYRSRASGLCNLGMMIPIPAKEQYKRFYFVDWVVLNKHKQELLPYLEVFVDQQREDEITWMGGADFRQSLEEQAHEMIRVRPWFESGVWGGQWLRKQIKGLPESPPNYAWSFELIVPENGVLFENHKILLEASFDYLMFTDNEAILGKSAERFGNEFPIRFDFLDTFDGGNLSLQCHPSKSFIQENFGENFTQDETYYIMDCKEGARVYLGFQDSIDREEFRNNLENSYRTGEPVPVERYVQTFSASRHDLFLIPTGTIHCSGKNNLVLEISNTPYIFTFKMYDWLRLDLNGKKRPINIERAFQNLRFDRKGEMVKRELLSKPEIIKEWEDGRMVHLPTHPEHFYDIHRLEFKNHIEVKTEGKCHILNLVEGDCVVVRTSKNEQIIHYAETFVIPAAVGTYTLINQVQNEVKVIKAFVKDEKNESGFSL